MHISRFRLIALLCVLGLIAAACGSSRDDAETGAGDTSVEDAAVTTTVESAAGEGDDGATTTAAMEDEAVMFGDIEMPCGPGDAAGATDVGITDDEILIGTSDDRGYVAAPGINRQQGDSVIAFVAYCNELGGINGRPITINFHDAAILNVTAAQIEGCEAGEFMWVGDGVSLDDLSTATRLDCGLPHFSAYDVSGIAAHAPLKLTGVPNPIDFIPMSQAHQILEVSPELTQNVATVQGDFSATVISAGKVRSAYNAIGWDMPDDLVFTYAIGGEDDWSFIINPLMQAGVESIYFSGACPSFSLNFMQQAAVQDYHPTLIVDANFLAEDCSAANVGGEMDGMLVRSVFLPGSERDANQALDQFIGIIEQYGEGELHFGGMQAVSSFLLWATAAKACGSDLTRECVLEQGASIEVWTAGGLHASTNPGSNMPPTCGALFELQGTEFVRVVPSEPGTFECDDSYVGATVLPELDALGLNEDRIAAQWVN